jgi:hypothetical protein
VLQLLPEHEQNIHKAEQERGGWRGEKDERRRMEGREEKRNGEEAKEQHRTAQQDWGIEERRRALCRSQQE